MTAGVYMANDTATYIAYFEYHPVDFVYSTYSVTGDDMPTANGEEDKFDTTAETAEQTTGNFAD